MPVKTRVAMKSMFAISLVCAALTLMHSPVHAQYRHMTMEGANPAVLPKKVLLLEPEVLVREMSAGGFVEKLPEATKKAVSNLQTSMRAHLAKRNAFEVID